MDHTCKEDCCDYCTSCNLCPECERQERIARRVREALGLGAIVAAVGIIMALATLAK